MGRGCGKGACLLAGLVGVLVLIAGDQFSRSARFDPGTDPRDLVDWTPSRAPAPSPSRRPEVSTPSTAASAGDSRSGPAESSQPAEFGDPGAETDRLGAPVAALGPQPLPLPGEAGPAPADGRTEAALDEPMGAGCEARLRAAGTADVGCLFANETRQRRDGSRPHFYISDLLIDGLGGAVVRGDPPFDRQPEGQHYKARYTADGDYEILGRTKVDVAAARRCLDGKWVHIAGDSTGRQLFNSLVIALDEKHTHHLVTKYDDCVAPYHQRRMGLLKSKPRNKTAIIENHMWLCSCRQHLVWWEQHWRTARDGIELNLTYSYKEWMYEAADEAMFKGYWPAQRRTGETVGNLFHRFKGRQPNVLIANSGAHSFHLPEMELDMPEPQAVHDYAINTTKYIRLIQDHYLGPNGGGDRCFLWKANNVPPTHKCPVHHYALNYFTVPALLKAGLHVIDPEELSSKGHPSGPPARVCDIHTAPQDKIAQLTLSAICQACGGGVV